MKRLGLYFAFVVLLACPPHLLPLQQQDATKTANHKEQASHPQAKQKPAVAAEERKEPNVQPQHCPAEEKTAIPNQDGPDYTFWALVVNGALTLVTLGIAITGIVQALAAKESADIALNSQRSWIVENGVVGPEMTHDWVKQIECHFKVIGTSPARVLESNFRFHLVKSRPVRDYTEPDLPEVPDYGSVLHTLANTPEMGKIRAPGDTFIVSPTLEGLFLKPEDIEAINKWEKFACAYGFIRYRDAFSRSKSRETRFCYVYSVWRSPLGKAAHPDHFVIGGPPGYNEAT